MATRPRNARAKAAKALRGAETVFLAGHVRPDGDCLGSALALQAALKRMGKRARVFSRDPVPENLSTLPGASRVEIGPKARGRFDAAVFLECSAPDRSGNLIDLENQVGTVVHIDSHLRSQRYGDVNLIESDLSSTAEQVYYLLKEMKAPIDKGIAACLYVGLVTDTGRFMYSNTTPASLRFAAELLEAGVPAARLNERLFGTHPLPALKLWSRALGRLKIRLGGLVAVQTVTPADLRAAGANPQHTEDIVNLGMMVPGVEASIILKKEAAGLRVSLRARGNVDVSRVAGAFGGGGHRNAAGCTMRGSLKSAEARLVRELSLRLKRR